MKKQLRSVGFGYDIASQAEVSLTRLANADEQKVFEAQDDEECYWGDDIFLVMAESKTIAESYYEAQMAAQFRLMSRVYDEIEDDD